MTTLLERFHQKPVLRLGKSQWHLALVEFEGMEQIFLHLFVSVYNLPTAIMSIKTNWSSWLRFYNWKLFWHLLMTQFNAFFNFKVEDFFLVHLMSSLKLDFDLWIIFMYIFVPFGQCLRFSTIFTNSFYYAKKCTFLTPEEVFSTIRQMLCYLYRL